jgi:hypothetical protein
LSGTQAFGGLDGAADVIIKTNQIKATPASFYLSFYISLVATLNLQIPAGHIYSKIALLSRCLVVMVLVSIMVCAALRVPEGQRNFARIILPERTPFLQRFS